MTVEPARRAVGVGASAGGVEALSEMAAALPLDLDAVVLVVLHVPPTYSALPSIMSRAGSLEAVHAVDGQPAVAGRILIAPPDHHMTVGGGRVHLVRTPRENGHRPSVDVLFRSIAQHYGPAGAGVVLSGFLDDGAAGLAAISARGGYTIVQDPEDATFADMPRSALEALEPDQVCSASRIYECLRSWLERPLAELPGRLEKEGDPVEGDSEEKPSEFTCPECGGTLWAIDAPGTPAFRCRVGHRYSAESLFLGKQEAVEAALWAAIVALEERRDLTLRMWRRMDSVGDRRRSRRYSADLGQSERNLKLLRGLFDELVRSRALDGGEGAG